MNARTSIENCLDAVSQPNRDRCLNFLSDNYAVIAVAAGSSHNHQAYPGGYLDHIASVMSIGRYLYSTLYGKQFLPFGLSDVMLVGFLHDAEKPWKGKLNLDTKLKKREFREYLFRSNSFELTDVHKNALTYVEGEGDDYSPNRRVMNELAAFCHMCDIASARIWHDRRVDL